MSSTLCAAVTQLAPQLRPTAPASLSLAADVALTVELVRVCTTLTTVVFPLPRTETVDGNPLELNARSAPAPPERRAHAPDVDMGDIVRHAPSNALAAPSPVVQFLPLFTSNDVQHHGSRSGGGGVVRTDVRAARKQRRISPYSVLTRAERKKRVSIRNLKSISVSL